MSGKRLATAEWMNPAEVQEKYEYDDGQFFIGRSPVDGTPLGFHDDRHICLVAGTRSGKGTTTIVNNLCEWPGSVVVNDPKGENATVTAARRGDGSDYCEGLGQAVHVLDPFGVSQVESKYRSRFNPLDALDPDNPDVVDEAGALADALVPTVAKDETGKFFETSARKMLKALILHVRTAPHYEGRRNLVTVRELVMCGDQESIEFAKKHGRDVGTTDPDELLWMNIANNDAVPALKGLGRFVLGNLLRSERQYSGSRETAEQGTEFLDSPRMQECVLSSDFQLSELKTDPKGVSVYLCLPSGKRTEHFRWLRMITSLFVMEMEKVSQQPANGHRVLLALDEFAGLKKMERLEQAAAELAGFGVKLFFVVQSLVQLREHYGEGWEVFLSNAGLKLFFGVDDNFTCEYISKMLGETEVPVSTESWSQSTAHSENVTDTTGRTTTESHSRSSSDSTNESQTKGRHQGESFGRSVNRSFGGNESTGENYSRSFGSNWSDSISDTKGGGRSESKSWDAHTFVFRNTDEYTHWLRDNEKANRASNTNWGRTRGRSRGGNESSSQGASYQRGSNWNQGEGETSGVNYGTSESSTTGRGHTEGYSESTSTAESTSRATSKGTTETEQKGGSVTLQKRPLATIDELRFMFDRIEEGGYGWCLVLAGGKRGIIASRCRYFEDDFFAFRYDPHPDHPTPPKLVGVETMALPETLHPRIIEEGQIEWKVAPGNEIERAQVIARVRLPVPTGDEGILFKQAYPTVLTPEAFFAVQATIPGTVKQIGPARMADIYSREERALAGFTVNRRRLVEIEDEPLVQHLELYSKFLYDLPAELAKLDAERAAEVRRREEEEARKKAEAERAAKEKAAAEERERQRLAAEREKEEKERKAKEYAAFIKRPDILNYPWPVSAALGVGLPIVFVKLDVSVLLGIFLIGSVVTVIVSAARWWEPIQKGRWHSQEYEKYRGTTALANAKEEFMQYPEDNPWISMVFMIGFVIVFGPPLYGWYQAGHEWPGFMSLGKSALKCWLLLMPFVGVAWVLRYAQWYLTGWEKHIKIAED